MNPCFVRVAAGLLCAIGSFPAAAAMIVPGAVTVQITPPGGDPAPFNPVGDAGFWSSYLVANDWPSSVPPPDPWYPVARRGTAEGSYSPESYWIGGTAYSLYAPDQEYMALHRVTATVEFDLTDAASLSFAFQQRGETSWNGWNSLSDASLVIRDAQGAIVLGCVGSGFGEGLFGGCALGNLPDATSAQHLLPSDGFIALMAGHYQISYDLQAGIMNGAPSHSQFEFELSTVPLPAALPLLVSGLGMLGLGWRRRRRVHRRPATDVDGSFFSHALACAVIAIQSLLPAPVHASASAAEPNRAFQDSRAPSGKFTIAVIPDTQYLFDEDRGNRTVVEKSLQWIVEHSREKNIVFTVHLGDIVNNGADARWGRQELAQASDVFGIFDRNNIQYGVVAGNHDIPSGTFDSERGATTYLDYFGPARTAGNRSYCGSTPDGYNNCYTFAGGNQRFLLLALDWRASDATVAWVKSKLEEFSGVPTIIATHEILTSSNDVMVNDAAVLSGYGQTLWDRLIKSHSQIFMTLNGHNWPAGAVVMKDLADREVYMHLVNYQDRYFSGSGMIRLYEFDLRANTVDVQTFSPYWLAHQGRLPPLAKDEVRLEDSANRFTMDIDFKERFAPEQPVKPTPPVTPERVMVDGTVAYWRFEGPERQPLTEGAIAARDLSGRGNDLTRVTLPNGTANDLVWTREFHPQQPSRGSLFFNGSKRNPAFGGAYLRTVDGAPINRMTFKNGYTIEAFLRLPEYCCDDNHAWMGAISRMGTGADLGRTADDPEEPLVTLTVSPSREFQWAVAPLSDPGLLTNWSFRVPTLNWYHVALVNDGKQTVMYINGSPDQRNPARLSNGLQTTGEYWMIGANHYGRTVEHSFYGWIGDVRIVNRPLAVREFMLGGNRQ